MVKDYEDILKERRETFDPLHMEQETDKTYYEDTFDTGIVDPLKEMRLGLGRKIIDTACDQINYANPLVKRISRSVDREEVERQDHIEQCLNGILQMIGQENLVKIRDIVKSLALNGEVYVQTYVDKSRDFPIDIHVHDPKLIFPNPGVTQGKLDDILMFYRRSGRSIKNAFSDYGGSPGEIDYMEYHSSEKYYVEAGNDTLRDVSGKKYPFDFLPWAHTYAGLGMYTGPDNPETLARGLLYGIRGIIYAGTRNMSQMDAIAGKWAVPTVMTEEDEKTKFNLEPGGITRLTNLDSTKIDNGVGPHPSLFAYNSTLKQEIEEWSPATLRGQPAPSVESGYGQAIVGGYARLRYGTILVRTEAILGVIMGHILRTVEKAIKEPVPIYVKYEEGKKSYRKQLVLKPEDISGYYFCEVSLEASDPEAQDRRKMLGANLEKSGVISRRYNLENYQGISNATDMMAETFAERIIEESEEIRALVTQKALEKLGMREEAALLKEQEQRQKEMQEMMTTGLPNRPPAQIRPGSMEEAEGILQMQQKVSRSPQIGGNSPALPTGRMPVAR